MDGFGCAKYDASHAYDLRNLTSPSAENRIQQVNHSRKSIMPPTGMQVRNTLKQQSTTEIVTINRTKFDDNIQRPRRWLDHQPDTSLHGNACA